MNQNFYEPNLCYNSKSSGFDQYQPPQHTVIHQPPQVTSVQARENLMKSIQTFLKKFNRISFRETPKVLSLAWEKFFEIQHAFREKQHQPKDIQELLQKLLKDLQIISEELAEYINSPSWNCPAFYDDDDEYTIQYREYLENSSNAIAPVLPTEEPDNSLSMGDEHLSTILETESDKLIKSSVENLVPIPSESEDFFDNESECDVPVCDDFTTFSNPLFDYDDDVSSKNISSKIDPHHFNAESDLIESLLNQDILTVSYPKIDYLLEEFSGELTHINLIPPGIVDTDFDPKEEIRLIKELLYDNSSPRPPCMVVKCRSPCSLYYLWAEIERSVLIGPEVSEREGDKFFAYFVGKILGGDQLLVILCGYSTKSLELGTSFLSMTMFFALDQGIRYVSIVILSFMNASQLVCPAIYACGDSLLLTQLCCDDIHDVTPRVSALAGCDIDVKEAGLHCNVISRGRVENGIMELNFVRTEYQLADMFTKALPEDRFQYLVRRIGMRCLTPAELEVLANESA
ncbi:hypothetical protein Tco_1031140 [Tanacetum coccineum]|uniref:Uncharacterized protein n=1 Tax=Tanacetum coccineum TaxID=301880 RepID=A0ABQ5G9V8_9ASTR